MKKFRKLVIVATALILALGMCVMTGCGESGDQDSSDPVGACNEAIEAIQVQERTDKTDEQCQAAREAYDALTDEQKEQLDDPDYFGLDTGDASKDDPLNQDEIGENEIIVASFGTSFNGSRTADIGEIEKAVAEAYPDWSVRRAFTSQIIINHIQARDGVAIDNVEQALQRAVDNEVKNLVIQPTLLMRGAEYDELIATVENYKDEFESLAVGEPILGEVGSDATAINAEKEAAAKAVVNAAVASAEAESIGALASDGTALVLMGHGTSHEAKVTYHQMQTQMDKLGYTNVFVGTVEGEPEGTGCAEVIEAVNKAGYNNVILRPFMIVAGDHANNDMAGSDEDSWLSQFEASGDFDKIDIQMEGMGSIADVHKICIEHIAAAIK